MFIYVLCEVATVSQLCISFPYVLHGLCEDYLTCDIAFNAVMPLSRASTRGRYSRIEGVTAGELCCAGRVVGVATRFRRRERGEGSRCVGAMRGRVRGRGRGGREHGASGAPVWSCGTRPGAVSAARTR